MNLECYQNYEYVIKNNINVIFRIIRKINYMNVDENKMFELGIQGIIQACIDFDVRSNKDFSKFCVKYIINNIKNKIKISSNNLYSIYDKNIKFIDLLDNNFYDKENEIIKYHQKRKI